MHEGDVLHHLDDPTAIFRVFTEEEEGEANGACSGEGGGGGGGLEVLLEQHFCRFLGRRRLHR